MDAAAIAKALDIGRLCQIGFVVRNVAESMKNYEETMGVGPFMQVEFRPEKSFVKGRPGAIHLKIGIAQLTPDLSLELIEVVGGEPYHKDFLEQHGEGVQHLGYLSEDYDGVLARAEALGIPLLMSAETEVPGMGQVRGAYFDTLDRLGTLVEVIEIKPFA
ncbi:MAG: VOC family protein [Deltaproteobacteria bacterium]|nr:VOC family protein [Deltaproteobacteria bacterium]